MRHRRSRERGSLTVEATLLLPVFIFAVASFLYFFQILTVQLKIQEGMFQTAEAVSQYAYLYQGKDGGHTALPAASLLYRLELAKHVDIKFLDQSCIKGGYAGIQFQGSSFSEADNEIYLVVSYWVKMDIPILSLQSMRVVQKCRFRGFVGEGEGTGTGRESEDGPERAEDVVYVTQNGVVYHESRACTHIELSIRSVEQEELESLRNGDGDRYKKCLLCIDGTLDGKSPCYITTEGDCYHGRISCSGLKRSVMAIPRSEIGERTPCRRCAK